MIYAFINVNPKQQYRIVFRYTTYDPCIRSSQCTITIRYRYERDLSMRNEHSSTLLQLCASIIEIVFEKRL